MCFIGRKPGINIRRFAKVSRVHPAVIFLGSNKRNTGTGKYIGLYSIIIIISSPDIPYQLPRKFSEGAEEIKIALLPVFGFGITAVVSLQAGKAHVQPGRQEIVDRLFYKKRNSGFDGFKRTQRIGRKITLVYIESAIEPDAHVFVKLGMAGTADAEQEEYNGCGFFVCFQVNCFLSVL